jgi:TPP-dependent pyruvate/acetoin dehydrogenase alpha subunit
MEIRKSFEKIKVFRVLDDDGNIMNKEYENSIDNETLKKMYQYMILMNEADVIFN